MPLKERDEPPLKDSDDIQKRVRHDHERQFAQLLLEKSFEVTYEPAIFEYVNGVSIIHLPDFKVVNPRTGGVRIVELTTSRRKAYEFEGEERLTDPKARERAIVQQVKEDEGLDLKYVVLYAGELQNIQDKNEGLDFFRERNQYSGK